MGNGTSSKKMLLNNDDYSSIKTRFSFSRSISQENKIHDKQFDITEKEVRELRNFTKQASITPFCGAHCFV